MQRLALILRLTDRQSNPEIVGQQGTYSPTVANEGFLDMLDITTFGASIGLAKNDVDNSALIQAAVNTKQKIFIPSGVWPVASPITYTDALLLRGECGYVTSGGKSTIITGTSALGYAPVFHRSGHYLRYSENGASPHQWVSSSGSASSVTPDAVVQIEHLVIRSASENNSCLQLFGCKQASVKQCQIGPLFRGIDVVRCDSVQLVQIGYGRTPNPSWVLDVARLQNSWAIMADGNTFLDQCNCQGGLTGLYLVGNSNVVSGGRYEVLHYACVLGGKSPNPSTLNQDVPFKASDAYTWTFESNRFPILINEMVASNIACFEILGSNAFNAAGTVQGQLMQFGCKIATPLGASASIRSGSIANPSTVNGGIVNNSNVAYQSTDFPAVLGVGAP